MPEGRFRRGQGNIPGFAGLCLHATSPPDTKARTSSAAPILKCQKQCITTVTQVLKLSPSAKIQVILSGADLYLNNDGDGDGGDCFKLDIMNEHPVLTASRIPLSECRLFESGGCLLLVGRKGGAHSGHFTIYEKRNDYSQWSLNSFHLLLMSNSAFGFRCAYNSMNSPFSIQFVQRRHSAKRGLHVTKQAKASSLGIACNKAL
nr:hypothetical protein [Tanacetum cinerariifolium]